MLKQFHLETKVFADPIVLVDDKGEPILSTPPATVVGEIQYATSGEGWFAVHTQEEIDGICASITGDGEVWADGAQLHYSGRKPDDHHIWDRQLKRWQPLTYTQQQVQQQAKLAEEKSRLLRNIADQTDRLKAQYLQGYSQAEIDSFYRQEREARGELPLMLLTELFEGRNDLANIEELKEKVIKKADIFAIIMGKTFAIKQGFEVRIEQAATLDALAQIDKEITQWQSI